MEDLEDASEPREQAHTHRSRGDAERWNVSQSITNPGENAAVLFCRFRSRGPAGVTGSPLMNSDNINITVSSIRTFCNAVAASPTS